MRCTPACGDDPARWLTVQVEGREGKHAITWMCRHCGATRLQLGSVEDIHAAVVHVADVYLRHHRVQYIDRDEFVAALLADAWALWLKWQPDRGVPFSAYLFRFLPLKATDWFRHTLGRNGSRILPDLYGLSHDADGRGLGGAHEPEPGDAAIGRSSDLARVLSG